MPIGSFFGVGECRPGPSGCGSRAACVARAAPTPPAPATTTPSRGQSRSSACRASSRPRPRRRAERRQAGRDSMVEDFTGLLPGCVRCRPVASAPRPGTSAAPAAPCGSAAAPRAASRSRPCRSRRRPATDCRLSSDCGSNWILISASVRVRRRRPARLPASSPSSWCDSASARDRAALDHRFGLALLGAARFLLQRDVDLEHHAPWS